MVLRKSVASTCLALLAVAAGVRHAAAQTPTALSERDYFEELPVVLSVSRLAQPLDEAPGAVTVIDKDILRRSGVRELADVLRLVPGFLVSQWNGASPVASYHNVLDEFGSRIQVFVDGRSVYSTFFLGGTQRGMMGLVLEDIERIEVLRGSNSAAFGANAFLGVINIVTRHAGDTQGALVSVTQGEQGISDNVARYGWGGPDASIRATVSRRSDGGIDSLYDDKRIGQLHLRGDLRPSARDEVMLQAGGARESWGDGVAGNVGNPQRTALMRSAYAYGEWRRTLAADQDVRLSFSHDDEYFRDRTPYAPIPGVFLDFGGKGRRTQAEFQHTFAPAGNWRAVWGLTWRDEKVWSPPLYFGQSWLGSRQWRAFGNLEWRPHPQWVINAGALWEKHSIVGSSVSPRLMANFHLLPGHTLRAGVTQSERAPTLFELKADVRYYDALNNLRGWTWDMRGNVGPEHLLVREVGYLGEIRPLGLSLDVRGFNEIMTDRIVSHNYNNGVTTVTEKINDDGTLLMRGYEYQLRWRPTATTQIWLNHLSTRNLGPAVADPFTAPHRTQSLAVFQALPAGYDLTLTYVETGAMTWRGLAERLGPQHRLDLRLAKSFRIGATRAEAAVVVQAANGAYREFLPASIFQRRTFATLRFEY